MPTVRYKARECPCCGGPGQVKTVNTPHAHGWVGCTACGLYIQWSWDPLAALYRWNQRADSPELPEGDGGQDNV